MENNITTNELENEQMKDENQRVNQSDGSLEESKRVVVVANGDGHRGAKEFLKENEQQIIDSANSSLEELTKVMMSNGGGYTGDIGDFLRSYESNPSARLKEEQRNPKRTRDMSLSEFMSHTKTLSRTDKLIKRRK